MAGPTPRSLIAVTEEISVVEKEPTAAVAGVNSWTVPVTSTRWPTVGSVPLLPRNTNKPSEVPALPSPEVSLDPEPAAGDSGSCRVDCGHSAARGHDLASQC